MPEIERGKPSGYLRFVELTLPKIRSGWANEHVHAWVSDSSINDGDRPLEDYEFAAYAGRVPLPPIPASVEHLPIHPTYKAVLERLGLEIATAAPGRVES